MISTFSATDPPLIWISIIWAFFCLRRRIFCWVWAINRTTEQYFLIWLKSFSISFLPKSSPHFNWALENAFFLDLDLYFQFLTNRMLEKKEKELRTILICFINASQHTFKNVIFPILHPVSIWEETRVSSVKIQFYHMLKLNTIIKYICLNMLASKERKHLMPHRKKNTSGGHLMTDNSMKMHEGCSTVKRENSSR